MNVSLQDAFALYKGCGEEADLSQEAFNKVWSAVCGECQEWWVSEFEKGKCGLVKQALNLGVENIRKRHLQFAIEIVTIFARMGAEKDEAAFSKLSDEYDKLFQSGLDRIVADVMLQMTFPNMHVAYIDSMVPKENADCWRLKRKILIANRDAGIFYHKLRQLSDEDRAALSVRFIIDSTLTRAG